MIGRLCLVVLPMILPPSPSVASPVADPLAGSWKLNVSRTHYGGGAEPRKEETFPCKPVEENLRCTIRSVRAGGAIVIGSFEAAYDGKPRAATGIPDVDQVSLKRVDDHIADATFYAKGRPVFGYRSIRSDDGRSITIVSVDPTTRTILESVVVYDRQ